MLRAAARRGRASVLIVVHGMFQVAATLHVPPIITSGSLALGRLQVVKAAPLPHQLKPRKSPPWPWITSDTISVLDVPSVMCGRNACGWPAGPYLGKYLPRLS